MTNVDFADLRAWMFDQALPFWGTIGMDEANGGYIEQLDLSARPVDPGFKRIRVICRQIYVFAHAHVLGWEKGLALSRSGYEVLIKKAWQGEAGGWARKISAEGVIIDSTADLYDNAFSLFALGWYYKASGDPEALSWALKTLDFIDSHMRHPKEGFLHEKPAIGHRQQNPHMHLLEALLVCYEASGNEKFATMAREVVGLFQNRFFDPVSQTLSEFFDDDLGRAPGLDGRITEPGHQFEWAWILGNAGRLFNLDVAETARGLIASGERHGVDPISGITYNQVREDGVPLDKGSRTWPNTERMKAAVAAFELFGTDPRPVLAQSGGVLLNRYLDVPVGGTWIDAFNEAGEPVVDKIPTSTLYHVFLAFAEALRIEDAVARAFP
ncbi:MAG: mannose-6-phosphate isomerase [Alphaproteobacteria bacterium PA3]|nr:MAG: mannose-6-phosphate isomerase [Alphaproteobacteria bacterium PA3]